MIIKYFCDIALSTKFELIVREAWLMVEVFRENIPSCARLDRSLVI